MLDVRSISGLAVSTALLMACASIDDQAPASLIAPMPGLGTSTLSITARDDQARAWFAQGLLLTYAFEHQEAARVFRAALSRDPSCAMCAWGVAYALGPNINNSDRGPLRDIRRYIARAQAAASGATARERALIDAMAVRYGSGEARAQQNYEAMGQALCSTRKTERKVDPQELAYAAAMGDVLRAYPDDPDVVTLYADAVMSTMPWEWWDPKTGRANGAIDDVITRLAAITAKHPRHSGALHFYVHVAEHSPGPKKAEVAADTLGTVAPESPHLVHMGSHIYKNIGRFDAGTRANEQALAVQKRFDAVLKAQGVQRSGRWDAHHQHFLWYAALMEGRADLASRTALDFAKRFGASGHAMGEYAQLLPWATRVRLQRWDEVLATPAPGPGMGLLEGYAAFARGMAHLHHGRGEAAKAELATVEKLAAQPQLQRAKMYDEPIPAKLMTVAQHGLAGSIARAEGRHEAAIAAWRKAADTDDELGNDPPLLGGGARLSLAAALLDAGKTDEARREIAEAERLNGPSAWSHQALALSASRRGARDEAQQHTERARAAWKNAQGANLPRL